MIILPIPREISFGKGCFRAGVGTRITLDSRCGAEDLEAALLLQKEFRLRTCLNPAVTRAYLSGEPDQIRLIRKDVSPYTYMLDVCAGGVDIAAASGEGLFYGVQTLRQIVASSGAVLPEIRIADAPALEGRGFMHDVTRGKVPKLETLLELADRAAYYKLNELQLYVEHSFAYCGMTEAWRGADPITPQEILELDAYCRRRHIELVPAFATFGHLYEALQTKTFRHLCELEIDDSVPYTWPDRQLHHTLDVSNPESIELARHMLDEFMPLFSSSKVNICCDETFDLGEGKNKALAQRLGKGRLYMDFLLKILGHVRERGKTALFWDDILLEHPEYLAELPRDVVCLTWYYAAPVRGDKIERIRSTGLAQVVCPGVSAWNRLAADMDNASANISESAALAVKHKALGLLNTDWGDYGHINPLAASIPGMALGAALAWNGSSPEPASMDSMISEVEYGDRSGRLVPLLRELGGLCPMSWAHLVAWHCRKFLGRTFEYPNTDELAQIPEHEAVRCRTRAKEIERELIGLSSAVYPEKKQDLMELVNAARGTAAMNGILLALKENEFKQLGSSCLSPADLAVEIESWFYEYSALWRVRSKQSELDRIQTMLFSICDYLRSL